MAQNPVSRDDFGRAQRSAADHYQTAEMHRVCALAILLDAERAVPGGPGVVGVPGKSGADPWMQLDKFEQHARLAELHTQLCSARIGAVQLLMQRSDEDGTPHQREAVEAELAAWADTIARGR